MNDSYEKGYAEGRLDLCEELERDKFPDQILGYLDELWCPLGYPVRECNHCMRALLACVWDRTFSPAVVQLFIRMEHKI